MLGNPYASSEAALHSFDVFDTLVTRCWWCPEDLFLHLGVRLREAGLLHEAPEAWAARRIAAEAALRRVPGIEEVDLAGIYAALAPALNWTEAEAHAAALIEIACEEEAVRPIASNAMRLAQLQAVGAEVALLSDTYLDHAALLRLLGRAGIAVPPERVFSSSELGATKRSGLMFETVSKALKVSLAGISHLGDHPHSDVAMPRAAGMKAASYTAGEPTRYENILHAGSAGHPAMIRSALAGSARAARLSADPPMPHHGTLFTVGADVAGPLLCGFTLWVLQEARRRGMPRLYFVSRDGQILKRIADLLCARLGWTIDCRYLLGSRQAWHLPGLDRLDQAALDWLAMERAQEPLRSMLARAGLTPEQLQPALQRHGFGDPATYDMPAPTPRLVALLRDPEVEAMLLAAAAVSRQAALGYLRQEGLFDSVPHAIVDLGWHGRLQRSLGRLLQLGSADGVAPELSGFYLALRSRPAEVPHDMMDAFIESPRRVARLNPVLLEIFCSAEHGTVRRYVPRQGGGFEATLASATDPRVLSWGLRTLHDGVLAFTSELVEAMARSPGIDPEAWVAALRDSGVAAYDLFRLDPSEEEAEAFGVFPHADGQSHETWDECAPKVRGLMRLRLGLGFQDPKYVGHWPEASIRRGGGVLAKGLMGIRRLKRRIQASTQARSSDASQCESVTAASVR
jgi:predicted HAD superfamily hydrolase